MARDGPHTPPDNLYRSGVPTPTSSRVAADAADRDRRALSPSPSPGSNQEVFQQTPSPPTTPSSPSRQTAPREPESSTTTTHDGDDDNDDDDTPEPEGNGEVSERRAVERDENLEEKVRAYRLNQRQIEREALFCHYKQCICRLYRR
ncbi:hypothetical protein NEUTE1DRAFT_139294 [Neurospora tetrasperma FGSC 2508]|uniref:Uncharacterized protein n=1 Tax=Neurospora tetrasperma (strain FGSC 2508 / ATCC MYA-4615 / P0657) TaxID=510951 RepID=F8MS74_NEUT8|nr:uncharacterized protein NEUTE1DRAFT_139294 [Neurospora tetrasperma FGSC 2508]EGO55015.1 hypothetical protein NEUTE1DRAFT_139294 [Neurospora tetrasperma FGSC 2508]EGZ69781.1 hypothetical protein NEUTE2DRAFT_169363 [Neurospora tetrasperma FGSC 2509]